LIGQFHCDFGVEPAQLTCGIVQETVTDDFDWRTKSQQRSAANRDWLRLAGHTTRDPDDVFFHMDGSDGMPYQSAMYYSRTIPILNASIAPLYHMMHKAPTNGALGRRKGRCRSQRQRSTCSWV